jgi:hypothetical protein
MAQGLQDMKKIFCLILFVMCFASEAYSQVYVTFNGDTTKIWDSNFTWNCIITQRKFISTIDTVKNIINIVYTDTSSTRAKCICKFTTYTSLVGLKAGTYTATVIRRLCYRSKVYTNTHVLKDTLILDVAIAGEVTFTVTKNSSLSFAGKVTQSECISEVVEVPKPIIPDRFELMQNYPNPFNPATIIKYSIPDRRGVLVTLKVFDLLGGEVTTLVNEQKSPGIYQATFNGISLPSGIYFYQLRAGSFVQTKKLVLIK